MTDIRKSLFVLFSGTLLTFGVWLAIFMTIDPNNTDPITIITFFSSLFLWMTGINTFIIVNIRAHMTVLSNENIIPSSLMHSFSVSLFLLILIVLQTLRVLGIVEGIIVAILFILFELYIKTKTVQ